MNIGVTVPAELVAELDTITEREGWNRSKAVTEAIRKFVKPAKQKRM